MRYLISLFFLLISTGAAALPAESSNLISHNELMRVIMGLLSVLLIIIFLSWIVKRLNLVKLSSSKGFQSIASMTLGPKEKMMLLKVGDRFLLMGVGASTVSLLYDFGEQLPPGFDSENKPAFAEFLKSAVGRK
ncbi:flagellar biosynthetic protein FliO [Legionella maioricensis]|uniref:Flagellar protein n=1 Tax=Legionella maioricensis TaxID=2896528 RepID=A0A9X2D141_9GAMM|nr:flagellar biosynthetic protein FliO [Legionella maioricensis]MCL9684389.1 flagellar biosynthetic protein FliO [Legionella maioricensis]MCL9687570.1 flagellar biosynthetic protein FliO [Legionella maioricensis]